MLGDTCWRLQTHSMKSDTGVATAAWPADGVGSSSNELPLGRSGSFAFVGTLKGGTLTVYRVELAAGATPAVFASFPLNAMPSAVRANGDSLWFGDDKARRVTRLDLKATTTPVAVVTYSAPAAGSFWSAAGTSVIFGVAGGSDECSATELHDASGKLRDLAPSGVGCLAYSAARSPDSFFRRLDRSGAALAKLDATSLVQNGTECGAALALDPELSSEDDMHIYFSERHPGVVGKLLHRIRKH